VESSFADSVGAQAERALQEERAQPEVTNGWHDDSPVAEIIGRGPDAMAVARQLAGSHDSLAQAAAAHILSYRVNGFPDYAPGAVAILAEMLIGANHLHLQHSIADALRLAWHVSAVEPLLTLADHSSPNVRQTVAMGLGGAMAGGTPVTAGVECLVRLSQDPEEEVRNWAAFELAGLDHGSEIVRAALWARVEDPHYDARSEALVGLARRRDLRVTNRVIKELTEGKTVGVLVVEAAAHLAQIELVHPLMELKDWWDVDSPLLDTAIDACRMEKPVEWTFWAKGAQL
jgi:HEAT repeat protein